MRLSHNYNEFRRNVVLSVTCLLLVVVTVNCAQARNWALLIGAGEYADEKRWRALPFTEMDVNGLEAALVDRGNYARDAVVKLYNKTNDELKIGILEFFKKPAAGDQVLLYFTGHGYRSDDGKLYLVPKDFDVAKAATTGIDVADLHNQVATCAAATKFVIIDACHAGTSIRVPASTIKEAFDGIQNVYTLASSTELQDSLEWPAMRQSLFTYWFVQAMKGHADRDFNGTVKLDDVWSYVSTNVSAAALHTPGGGDQTPVRNVLSGTGSPIITVLKPQPLEVAADDMAEQITVAVQLEGLGPVAAYPQFTTFERDPTGLKEVLSQKLAVYGQLSAAELNKRLVVHGTRNKVSIVPGDLFKGVLSEQATTAAAITDPNKNQTVASALSSEHPDRLVEVHGVLDQQHGAIVTLHAEARKSSPGMPVICQVGGRVDLTKSSDQRPRNDWPLLGKSIVVERDDFTPSRDPATGDDRTPKASAAERWDNAKVRLASHPLQDNTFPFRVGIWLNGKSQAEPIVYRDNDAYVGLDEGDQYFIRVDYSIQQPVHLKLLVDGISTRDHETPPSLRDAPEQTLTAQLRTKGIAVQVAQSAVPTSLGETSAWVLRPENKLDRYFGFYVLGPDGTHHSGAYCPFIVTKAADSLAAEREFTDQIGLITAIFYEDAGMTLGSPLGTKAGDLVEGAAIQRVKAGVPGHEIAVVHIHYVSRQSLAELAVK